MSKETKETQNMVGLTGKQIRQARFEQMQNKSKEDTAEQVRESFRQYFATLKRKLNLSPDLEQIIWNHMVQCGFAKVEQFDNGIKHFGYKI